MSLSAMSRHELNRAMASARNRRDAFAAGREPADVLARVAAIQRELDNRRAR